MGRNPEVVWGFEMNCPNCKSNQVIVIDSRPRPASVHRRRKCLGCDLRFSTVEVDVAQHRSLISAKKRLAAVLETIGFL